MKNSPHWSRNGCTLQPNKRHNRFHLSLLFTFFSTSFNLEGKMRTPQIYAPFLTRVASCGRPRTRPMHKSLHSSKRCYECSTHQHRKTENEENTPSRKSRKMSKWVHARGTSSTLALIMVGGKKKQSITTESWQIQAESAESETMKSFASSTGRDA